MEEETRRRLGIGLAILGFIIIVFNGVLVIGHYRMGNSFNPQLCHWSSSTSSRLDDR